MQKNHTPLAWISLPVQHSIKFNYREVEKLVTKLCGVNNSAERAVKAACDRIGSVRFEKTFHATPIRLEELRRLSSVIKWGTFTKKQISILHSD